MYSVRDEQFEGPLDLLLSLIEKEKLDVTQISLAKITSAYLATISEMEGDSSDLADFLVIAAKLLYLKSKELIPNAETKEEENEIADLEERLREYQSYKLAAQHFDRMLAQENRSFRKRSKNDFTPTFTPPDGINSQGLFAIFNEFLQKADAEVPEKKDIVQEKKVTLSEKREHILSHIKKHGRSSFRTILGKAKSKAEVIVTFLAILEMVKQKEVRVEQETSFADFQIVGVK